MRAGFGILAIVVVAFCWGVTPCRADQAADAQAAFRRGDYSEAQRLWEPLAESGDTQAQIGLAAIYARDEATLDKAKAWLELAGERGDYRGPLLLGVLYEIQGDIRNAYRSFDIAQSLADTKVDAANVKLLSSHVRLRTSIEEKKSAGAEADEWRASHPYLFDPQ